MGLLNELMDRYERGEKVQLRDGRIGTVIKEVWGNRVIIEVVGNLSHELGEVVADKSHVRRVRGK